MKIIAENGYAVGVEDRPTCMTFVLCKSRHPLVGTLSGLELPALFPETVDMSDPTSLVDGINVPSESCFDKHVNIIVTGLTPCLIAAINYFKRTYAKTITLWHYDREKQNYWMQRVVK